jgi:hypothetical protein
MDRSVDRRRPMEGGEIPLSPATSMEAAPRVETLNELELFRGLETLVSESLGQNVSTHAASGRSERTNSEERAPAVTESPIFPPTTRTTPSLERPKTSSDLRSFAEALRERARQRLRLMHSSRILKTPRDS